MEAKRITSLNMQHAKAIVGQNRMMVLSVLNTNSILQANERNICKISKEVASLTEGVEYHQNGVNVVALNPNASLKRIEKYSVETNKSGQGERMLWTVCKSGKDRTFALIMRNAAKVFGAEKPAEFIQALSASSHAETMASGAGATRGAYGLKLKEMFFRMKDAVLGAVKGRLTNSISGVNTMHATKLRHEPVYKKIFDEQTKESHVATNQGEKGHSAQGLAQRAALSANHKPQVYIPPAPYAVAKNNERGI